MREKISKDRAVVIAKDYGEQAADAIASAIQFERNREPWHADTETAWAYYFARQAARWAQR